MKGDIIIVEQHHRRAADLIVDHYEETIAASPQRFTMSVAGESGSGKSETAKAVAEGLARRGIGVAIFQQDDYFVHPPLTNDRTRRANLCWVGPTEVRLDLLDDHLAAARRGVAGVRKPLVIYEEDRIEEEDLDLAGSQAVIAEGTYTSLLDNIDLRIFIARNRLETMEHRAKRGREKIDPFIERVLEIEHGIISEHRELADVVITRDYDVEFVGR